MHNELKESNHTDKLKSISDFFFKKSKSFTEGYSYGNIQSVYNEKKIQSHSILIEDNHYNSIKEISKNSPINLFVAISTFIAIALKDEKENNGFIFHTVPLKNRRKEIENTVIPLILEQPASNTLLREYMNNNLHSVKQSYLFYEKLFDNQLKTKYNFKSNVLVLSEELHNIDQEIGNNYNLKFLIKEKDNSISVEIDSDDLLDAKIFFNNVKGLIYDFLDRVQLHGLDTEIGNMSVNASPKLGKLICLSGENFKIEESFLQLFDRQALNNVNKIAIKTTQGDKLSFAELRDKSNAYAYHINHRFNGKKIIGIMLPQSADLIISILALWRIGATLVPIDPSFPNNRIKVMVESAGVELIIGSDTLVTNGFNIPDLPCISFNNEDIIRNIKKGKEFNKRVALDQIAYIIFTSGSTGVPRGVQITHESFSNYLQWASSAYLTPNKDETFALFGSISSDLVLTSIFLPLISGNTIIVSPSQDKYISLKESFFGKACADIIKLTPSHVDLLTSFDEKVTSVSKVILGGEILRKHHVASLLALNANIKIYNEYGPTETTIGCTMKEVLSIDEVENQSVGRPIWNTQIYVMDKKMKLLQEGEKGEVYIAGKGLSVGYLNSTKKNQQRFLQHPNKKGETLYKTGDIGIYLTNGEIAIIDRVDRQIKLNGNRVEIGEIEAHLELLNLVKKAYVILLEDDDIKLLIAFLQLSEKDLSSEYINSQLSTNLPQYMIPNRYYFIESFPVTSSGKVDEKALLKIQSNDTTKKYSSATNEKEVILIKIWEEVLGVKNIGIDDNFFHLGGDSIKSMQIAFRLKKLNYYLDVADILEYTTLAAQAEKITVLHETIISDITFNEFTLSPIQMNFFKKDLKYPHHYNHSILLKLNKNVTIETLNEAFEKLFSHHDSLKLKFQRTQEEWRQQYSESINPEIISYDLRSAENKEDIFLEAVNKLHGDMNLGHSPLLRIGLFDMELEKRLIIIIHHLLVDSVSWRILIEDLDLLIGLSIRNEALNLPSKTYSYERWIYSLKDYCLLAKYQGEIQYWLEVNSQIVEVIPMINKDTDADYRQKKVLSFCLSSDETNNLLTKANKAYNTHIDELLLLSLGLAVQKRFQCEKVPVFVEGHGRQELEGINVNRTIGWFTSLYPVIIPVSPQATMHQLIISVKEYLRKIPAKGIGYGLLKYFDSPQNKLENSPQLSFNYFGHFDPDLKTNNFQVAESFVGNHMNLQEKMDSQVAVTGYVVDNTLKFHWEYNNDFYDGKEVKLLVENFREILREVIILCCSKDYNEKTPSDFVYNDLDINDLDDIFND